MRNSICHNRDYVICLWIMPRKWDRSAYHVYNHPHMGHMGTLHIEKARTGRWCAGLTAAALVLGGCGSGDPSPVAVAAGFEPGRLLTELSAQATSGGVVLKWKVDEAQAHRITGFTCVYRTPGHGRLGVAGSVACGDAISGAEARERIVAGLPEYGEYLFEVTAQFQGAPVIEWSLRSLQVRIEVAQDHAGPPGPEAAVTGEGPVVFGCGPGGGVGDASAGRPWQLDDIVAAEHLTHYPGRGWAPGGDSEAPPEWPEPPTLAQLFDEAGLDGQVVQQALDSAGADGTGADGAGAGTDAGSCSVAGAAVGDAAALLADDASTVPLGRASAGTKALLRRDGDGWQLRLHTSYPFGADYVYAPSHAVAGWGDPAHPAAWAGLWNRVDCPPLDNPDASHDVALALSDDAGAGRSLEHSGYGWWAVAPVGMFPDRIVATKAGLAYGDPATEPPEPPATYQGRVSGHLFWNQQRYALAGDLTLTLERAGGAARLAGRIDNVVVVALDHESLQTRPGQPRLWRSLMLEAGEAHHTAWSGASAVGEQPPAAGAPRPAPARRLHRRLARPGPRRRRRRDRRTAAAVDAACPRRRPQCRLARPSPDRGRVRSRSRLVESESPVIARMLKTAGGGGDPRDPIDRSREAARGLWRRTAAMRLRRPAAATVALALVAALLAVASPLDPPWAPPQPQLRPTTRRQCRRGAAAPQGRLMRSRR